MLARQLAYITYVRGSMSTLQILLFPCFYSVWSPTLSREEPIVAAYIRRYIEVEEKWHNLKRWSLATLAFVSVDIISVILCYGIGQKTGINMLYGFVSDSNSFLALATGISVFLMFKNLKVRKSKVINFWASGTLGVLLIHANNSTMRRWLWKDTLGIVSKYDKPLFIIYAAIAVIGIYLICTLIDWARKLLVEDFYIRPFARLEKIITTKIISH